MVAEKIIRGKPRRLFPNAELSVGPVPEMRIAAEGFVPQPMGFDPGRAHETQKIDDDHQLFPFVLYDE
jgi:hypothetical protein